MISTKDVLKSSLSIYEEKLKKLIAKRDSEIALKCKELEEQLTETLYAEEVKELQEAIANLTIMLEKEEKNSQVEEPKTEEVQEEIVEQPKVEETQIEEPKIIMSVVKVEEPKKVALPLFSFVKKKSTNETQVGRKGVKTIVNPKRG